MAGFVSETFEASGNVSRIPSPSFRPKPTSSRSSTIPQKLPQTAADAVATMSHSKTEMWFRCQYQWFSRYVRGIRRPPGAALALGRATDTTAATFYAAKIESGEDMSRHDTLELWREQWEDEAEKVVEWEHPGDKERLTDMGTPTIARWREKIATQIVPLHTKVWFELVMKGDWTLNGEIDLVHRPRRELHRLPIPSDTKMTQKRWGQKQAWSTLQPAIYTLALDHSPDIQANTSLFQFHIGVLYDPNTKRADTDCAQILTRRVTENEKDGALARIGMARRQIMAAFESGDFMPNRLNVMCSRRHCAYWESCEKKFGPRVPD